MAAIHGRISPIANVFGACHTECYRPLPQRGRVSRDLQLNPEVEDALPPALRERNWHLRELEFHRDYKGPVSAGVCLG